MDIREHLPRHLTSQMVDVDHTTFDGAVKTVPHLKHEHKVIRDVNAEHRQGLSHLDRIAIVVTDRVGTFGFFLIILAWTMVWLGWNTVGPSDLRYDPAPAFVLWLFVSNMIQIFLMPLIMVGQNLQGRHSELRAQADFEVNQKAENEIEVILAHLEHQAAQIERQGELILEILKRISAAERAGQQTDRPSASVIRGDVSPG